MASLVLFLVAGTQFRFPLTECRGKARGMHISYHISLLLRKWVRRPWFVRYEFASSDLQLDGAEESLSDEFTAPLNRPCHGSRAPTPASTQDRGWNWGVLSVLAVSIDRSESTAAMRLTFRRRVSSRG